MIMTKKEDGTYKQVGFIYRNDEINVSGEVPIEFKTMDGTIGNYMIEGNTYQSDGVSPDTPQEVQAVGDRTGNLFDSAWEQGSINGTTGQNEVAGTLVRTKDYIPIKPNIAYSFSRNISNGYMNLRLYRADKSYIGSGSASTIRLISGVSVGNPMGNNASFCCFEVIDGEASYIRFNDSSNNTATKWLMVEGEYTQQTMPEYEPYGYKIPVETRGKNLFDGWEVSKTFLGLTCETSENMTIVLNGTRIAGLNAQPITRPNITLKAGTYTVSCKMIGGSMEGVTDGVFFGINQSTYAQRTSPAVLKVGDIGKRTFTLTEDTIISSFDITPSYGSPGGIFTNATFECQFEYGSEATEYEPYHEPITTPIYLGSPLYKIGDYADTLGMKEEVRAIKELVLTGEETWELQSINGNGIANFFIRRSDAHKSALKLICTHFTEQITQIANTATEGVYNANGNAIYIRVKQERASTATNFKAYLAAQYANGTPVTVYYILAEPETKSIELPKIPTLDGTNIIDINTEIKPSNISLSRPMTEIKKILNKEGKILFEKGFTREVESVLPLTLNSIDKPLKNYTIYGNTIQNGTPTTDNPVEVQAVGDRTGNLFDKTSDIVDFYISSETGVYTATTGNSRSILIKCSPETTYTVYVPTNATLRMVTFDQYPTSGDIGSDYIHKPTDYYVDKTLSITTGTTAQYLCIFCYNSVQEATQYDENEYFSQIMLNEGETALPYEPYGYKIPVETRGKNFFDVTKNVIGNIREDGSVQETSSELYNSSDFIAIKANADYTVSFLAEYNLGGRVSNIAYYDSEKNFLTYTTNTFNGVSEKSYTTTSPSNAKYLRFSFIGRGSTPDKNVQLELGSEVTEYEPYHEPITTTVYLDKPLYKIDDYADSTNYGEQKAERVVRKTRLMNPLSVETLEDVGYRVRFSISAKPAVSYTQSHGAFCNIAKYNSNYANIGFVPSGNIIYITQNISEWATIEGATEWFENHEIYVYYILATPETESVTLPKIPTLNGTTVIDVETEIEPSNMYVKYKSSK